MKPLNIAILRPFGGNVGNHVINRGVKHLIAKSAGDRLVNFLDLPVSKKLDGGLLSGLDKASTFFLNEVADGVIIGGGNLYENGEIDADESALAALRPPLMLFSNSLGRIYGRSGSLVRRTDSASFGLLERLTEKSLYSLSRDSSTHRELSEKLKLKSELGYCPTIHTAEAYRSQLNRQPERKNVYISIRNPERISGSEYIKYLVTNALELVIKRESDRPGASLRILCNDFRDVRYAEYLYRRFGVLYEYTADDVEFINRLNSANQVYSFRLHTTIPCAALGRPVINFSYDERAQSLIRDIGLGPISINLADHEPNEIDSVISATRIDKAVDLKSWKRISDLHHDRCLKFFRACEVYESEQ